QDAGPPSSLYLGVRAARQAVRDNPDDPRSYLVLAEIYSRLARRTRERARGASLAHVGVVRQSQVTGSLRSLLALNPRPELAQRAPRLLAEAFERPEYHEMQVFHFREFVRLCKQLGAIPGTPPNHFREHLEFMESNLKTNERQLNNRRDQYLLNSARKPLM